MRNLLTDANTFYDTGPSGLAELCRYNGEAFGGFLSVADADAWDSAIVSTHTLQYATEVPLITGAIVSIADVDYRVVGQPRQLSAFDKTCQLVRL